MAMESLGGNLTAGRPAAVFARGNTHVFAIGSGGVMNHWVSPNGIDWQGPGVLPRHDAGTVLPLCDHCWRRDPRLRDRLSRSLC